MNECDTALLPKYIYDITNYIENLMLKEILDKLNKVENEEE